MPRRGGEIIAHWYLPGRKGAVKRTTLKLKSGRSEVAFWLKLKTAEETLPVGKAWVDLSVGKKRLKRVKFKIRQAGLFESLGDTLEQAGDELESLIEEMDK